MKVFFKQKYSISTCIFTWMWCTDITEYACHTDVRRRRKHNSRAGLHCTTEKKKHFCSARAAEEKTSIIQMTPLTVTTSTILVKLQAAVRHLIKHHHYLRIKQAIISFQSCARRLLLFCEEKDIPEELIFSFRNNDNNIKFVTQQRFLFYDKQLKDFNQLQQHLR
jgi:hypothetical protein